VLLLTPWTLGRQSNPSLGAISRRLFHAIHFNNTALNNQILVLSRLVSSSSSPFAPWFLFQSSVKSPAFLIPISCLLPSLSPTMFTDNFLAVPYQDQAKTRTKTQAQKLKQENRPACPPRTASHQHSASTASTSSTVSSVPSPPVSPGPQQLSFAQHFFSRNQHQPSPQLLASVASSTSRPSLIRSKTTPS